MKSLKNISIFVSYGLWDYHFSEFSLDPRLNKAVVNKFREKFYRVLMF